MAADAPRFFNVWLVQPNTVYRGVPYTVVCDWIHEGRLLARDCVRTPGAPAWEYIDAHPLFSAYFTGEHIISAEDASEALDPIELEFPIKPQSDEDEDVDMIPLIDISMVLLVFFMMTAQNLISATPFQIPSAKNAIMFNSKGELVVSIRQNPTDPSKVMHHFTENYTEDYPEAELLKMIKDAKAARGSETTVLLQAQGNLPFEKVQHLMIGIQKMGINKIVVKTQGTSSGGS